MNCRNSLSATEQAACLDKLGDELSSSLLKALGEETVRSLASLANAQKGDAVLIVTGKVRTVAASLWRFAK